MTISASDVMDMMALLVVIAAFMIIEARRATANERIQRARGGIEPRDDVYQVMRFAYPGIFLAMLAEGVIRKTPFAAELALSGFTLFIAAKALKWWALLTLGEFWTFRVIVVPDSTTIATGPYRVMRHPNYVAVVGEIVGVALMTGALVTGPLALIAFGALLLRRIVVENRARDAILRRG